MGDKIVKQISDAGCPCVFYSHWAHYLQYIACTVQPFRLLQKGLGVAVKGMIEQRETMRQ